MKKLPTTSQVKKYAWRTIRAVGPGADKIQLPKELTLVLSEDLQAKLHRTKTFLNHNLHISKIEIPHNNFFIKGTNPIKIKSNSGLLIIDAFENQAMYLSAELEDFPGVKLICR